jgi:hypothetical protein
MFDDELWPLAQAEQRTLVTTDKGFSAHRDERHYGLLVVRLRQPNERRIHARIMAAFRRFTEREGPGLFVVMRDTGPVMRRAISGVAGRGSPDRINTIHKIRRVGGMASTARGGVAVPHRPPSLTPVNPVWKNSVVRPARTVCAVRACRPRQRGV